MSLSSICGMTKSLVFKKKFKLFWSYMKKFLTMWKLLIIWCSLFYSQKRNVEFLFCFLHYSCLGEDSQIAIWFLTNQAPLFYRIRAFIYEKMFEIETGWQVCLIASNKVAWNQSNIITAFFNLTLLEEFENMLKSLHRNDLFHASLPCNHTSLYKSTPVNNLIKVSI